MIRLIVLFMVISILSCKEKPTYNPFDDQFNVSVISLVRDGCDTISAGCGYFNLTQSKVSFPTYYQIYFDDWDEVVAKGFSYALDTFVLESVLCSKPCKDSILNLPMDIEVVNVELGDYGYEVHSKTTKDITIINPEKIDTIMLDFSLFKLPTDQSYVRMISYFYSNEIIEQ